MVISIYTPPATCGFPIAPHPYQHLALLNLSFFFQIFSNFVSLVMCVVFNCSFNAFKKQTLNTLIDTSYIHLYLASFASLSIVFM